MSVYKNIYEEVYYTLNHARIFITSRQKMHSTGVELWDDLMERVKTLSQQSLSGSEQSSSPKCPNCKTTLDGHMIMTCPKCGWDDY